MTTTYATGYRRKAGLAGAITQAGAVIKTVNRGDTPLDVGTPVKISSGKAVAMTATDDMSLMWGIVIRNQHGFNNDFLDSTQAVISEGFVQVPMTAEETPSRGAPVYWNASTKKFTTTATSNVAIRAVFAADGQADGVAEIQVIATPLIPHPEATGGVGG